MESVHKALLLVTDEPCERVEAVRAYALEQGIELREVTEQALLAQPRPDFAGISHLLAVVADEQVSACINLAERLGLSLGLVPKTGQLYVHHWFRLPHNSAEAIALAFSARACKVDLLRCNDELVLGMAMLGDTPFIDLRSKVYRNRSYRWLGLWFYRLALFWSSVRRLLSIHPFAVTLSTAHEPKLRTAITGLVVIENDVGGATA
jgi:diacylglycerol kinase family enzyme